MTGIAIFNPEGLPSVVAGATRLTNFHVIHGGHLVRAAACLEKARVTFVTAEHVKMVCVRKDRLAEALIKDIAAMTARAILFDVESITPVMAGPARGTGFHRRHSHLVAIRFSPEQIGMTFTAAEHLRVNSMAESSNANILRLYRHVNGIIVASDAIVCNTESRASIMT
jgi:hypothetical protein